MNTEEFEKARTEITDVDLIKKARDLLSELCKTGGKSFRMTVPPRIDDTDMIFSELIKRYQQMLPAGNADYGEIAGQKLRELNMHETMKVYGGEHLTIECMRVPGGFIYQYSEYHPSENEHLTTSTVFVPEPMQLEYSTSQEISMDKLFEE